MNKNPEITVLMSCYNAVSFVEEAIESILAQTYKKFEFLIIDDGSTDETYSILEKYQKTDSRIRVIKKENSGLTNSLNLGLKESKGKWIARLDADDIALPERLELQLKYCQEHDVALIGGGAIIIDEQGDTISKYNYSDNHQQLVKRLEKGKAFFAHSSAFFSKQSILDLGAYNELFSRAQDKDLWFRIAEKYNIACLFQSVIKLRQHNDMISKTENHKLQVFFSILATICHYKRIHNELDPSLNDNWQDFQSQVDKILTQFNFFQNFSDWYKLRQMWYKLKYPKILKSFLLFLTTIKQPYKLKNTLKHIVTNNISWKIYKKL